MTRGRRVFTFEKLWERATEDGRVVQFAEMVSSESEQEAVRWWRTALEYGWMGRGCSNGEVTGLREWEMVESGPARFVRFFEEPSVAPVDVSARLDGLRSRVGGDG